MSTVRGAECIVDKKISVGGKFLRKLCIVLLLLRVEAFLALSLILMFLGTLGIFSL